jgi:hypothetical protein
MNQVTVWCLGSSRTGIKIEYHSRGYPLTGQCAFCGRPNIAITLDERVYKHAWRERWQ